MKISIDYTKVISFFIYLLPISFFIGKLHNVVGGLIVALFLYDIIKYRKFYIFKDKIFIFFFLWFLYLCLGALWATHKEETILSAFKILLWVLLYLSINNFFNSLKKLEKYFIFQAYLIVFIASCTLFQMIIGFNFFGIPLENGRTTDIFTSDRIFPFILPLYVGIFGAMLSLKDKNKEHYLLYSIALFGLIVSLITSGTRGPMVILAIFIPIIAWTSPYRKFAFSILAILVIAIGVIIGTNDKLQDRISTLLHPFENQKHFRIAIYKTAFEMFKENPIVGVGFKNFRYREFEYYKPEFESYEIITEKNKMVLHPHSPWLEILSEQGIVGFCFLLILFGKIFINIYKNGLFIFISSFSVLYSFSILHSTFTLSSSRWSFFMFMSVVFYALLVKYYSYINKG